MSEERGPAEERERDGGPGVAPDAADRASAAEAAATGTLAAFDAELARR